MPFKKTNLFIISSILLFSTILSNTFLQASEITGTGSGSNLSEAKQNALSDLSQQIMVQVDSSITIEKRKKNSSVSKDVIQSLETRTSLPLIGVVFSDSPQKDGKIIVYAKLDTTKKDIYKNAMSDTKKLILKNEKESRTGPTKKRIKALESVLQLMDTFAGYKAVSLWLGVDEIPDIEFTSAYIENEIFNLTTRVDTLELAAEIISQKINQSEKVKNKKIFIYPPVPFSSDEITPFSKAFYTRFLNFISPVNSPEKSEVITRGSYSINKSGIDLSYNAWDRQGNIIESGFVKILPQAYINYTPEPSLKDFSELVKEGIIVSDKLNIDITTSKGKKHLLFSEGERVNLFARMTKPGYFYILAHNLKEEQYSYLLDFYDSIGNEKFIFNVSPEMVNKWINIGEFEVVPPFGVEKLEIFASTKNPAEAIPQTFFDKTTKLYRLNKDPSQAVVLTRALIRKNREQTKAETAESFITITTAKNQK
ncbi:MAG: LPP20 family lipoprotein [Desulfobacteraceae bacterium]|nr:LPP20 family lipoprotein [Desulfobacteraceae bacterium]MCB9494696.1 LPP20 family lipoprotein [Desulfobacteraceae bacterium]